MIEDDLDYFGEVNSFSESIEVFEEEEGPFAGVLFESSNKRL